MSPWHQLKLLWLIYLVIPKGTLQGHNFIDKKLVDRHGLYYEVFASFGVKVVDGAILGCSRRIP